MRIRNLISLTVITGIAVACSSEPAGKSTSTVSGNLEQASYPSAASRVIAQDETGHEITQSVSATGGFKLDLKKGHRYRLAVELTDAQVPVVFPRADNSLGQWIDVQSGGAVANLGKVTYYGSLPSSGFKVTSADGECEDGIDALTGAPCVDEDGDVSCEDGTDDGECENGVDAVTGAACVDEGEDGAPDGECEDGVDVTTGAACTDVEDASAEGAMAVAEHNAPSVLGGCDDGEEADD